MFPELLFRLRPGEEVEPMQWLSPLFSELQTILASVQVAAPSFIVPTDRSLLLETFSIDATPGAAQNVTGIFLEFITPALLATFVISQDRTAGAANVSKILQATGVGLLIPAGRIIRARATFNAGAAANVITQELGGLLLPIGNVQRT